MRTRLALALVLSLVACRRREAPARAEPESSEDAPLPGSQDAGTPAACAVASRRAVRAGRHVDAGESDTVAAQAFRVIATRAGRRALWVDGAASELVLASEGGAVLMSRALGAGERSDPALATLGASATPAVAWSRDGINGRAHIVRAGERLERGCRGPETRDEGLSIAAVGTARGLLVAWDDDGPRPAAGSIKLQLITPASLAEGDRDEALPPCPAARQVSAPEQDASDPVLVPTPDGAAVVVWLTARDIDATQANDTVTDLWAQALDASGASVGRALRLTNAVGHRFGVSASAADATTVWVAFRLSEDSDSESRGDGGEVAVVRVERGPDGLVRASDPLTVTGDGANPTGAPAVFARAQRPGGARVFWRERRGPSVRTFQRQIEPSGTLSPGAVIHPEPALAGELPIAVDSSGHLLAPHPTGGGGVELLRVQCASEAR